MRYTEILALAMGNLAAAQFSSTSFTNSSMAATTEPGTETGSIIDTATGIETATGVETATGTEDVTGTGTSPVETSTSTSTSEPEHPDIVGNFRFLGCVASDSGFPSFVLAEDSEENDLNSCADACAGSNFFGTYDNTCYCGSTIDVATTDIVSTDSCDIVCPGDATQFCGGIRSSSRLRRRQSVDISVLLSIYVSVDFNADGTTETVTNTVTAVETETLPPVTTTATVTTAIDGTITTATVTTVIAAIPTDVVIICYGNYCAPQVHCPSCTKWQVVCQDGSCAPRECHDDSWDRLVICESGLCRYANWEAEECNQRVICYGSQCTWDRTPHKDYQKKFIRYDDEWCYHEECTDDCWTYNSCENNKCRVVETPPKVVSPPKPNQPGDKVILPPPVKQTPPCQGDKCQPPVVVQPPVDCSGDHCVPKPSTPEPKPSTPEHPCVGKDCVPVSPPVSPPSTGKPSNPSPEHPSGENPSNPAPEHPSGEKPVAPPAPETPSGGKESPEAPGCTGDHCVPETGNQKPDEPVVTAGAAAMLPATGLAFAIAGVAFLL